MAKHKKFSLKKKKNYANNQIIKKIARRRKHKFNNSKLSNRSNKFGENLAEDGYENIVLHYLSKLKHLFKPKIEGEDKQIFRNFGKKSEPKDEARSPRSNSDGFGKKRLTGKAKALNIVLAALDYGLANHIIGRKGNFFWFKRGVTTKLKEAEGLPPIKNDKLKVDKKQEKNNENNKKDDDPSDKKGQRSSRSRSRSSSKDSNTSRSSRASSVSKSKTSRSRSRNRSRTRSETPYKKPKKTKQRKLKKGYKSTCPKRASGYKKQNLFKVKKTRGSIAKRCHCSICTRKYRNKK